MKTKKNTTSLTDASDAIARLFRAKGYTRKEIEAQLWVLKVDFLIHAFMNGHFSKATTSQQRESLYRKFLEHAARDL